MIEAGPVAYCLPGRINAIASSRGLRPRLPSLRSVVPSRHLTPKSINASVFCDDNGDNLGQLEVVFCGRNRNNQRNIFAHELHEWARRQCATGMATESVALICTNAMRGG